MLYMYKLSIYKPIKKRLNIRIYISSGLTLIRSLQLAIKSFIGVRGRGGAIFKLG